MAVYPEVPMWWYALTFLLNFALGFAAILAWPTGLPAWVGSHISTFFACPSADLTYSISYAGLHHLPHYRLCLCAADRNRPGHHQPTGRPQRHHRGESRFPRMMPSKDAADYLILPR